MRVVLANGVIAYVAPDRMLPLVNVQVLLRGGAYLEPKGKEGFAELAAPSGGPVGRPLDAAHLDEELDFLAAQGLTDIGSVRRSVSLNLLSKDIDHGWRS